MLSILWPPVTADGVGDPLGPDFAEPADFDSFHVKIVGGGFSASLQPARWGSG